MKKIIALLLALVMVIGVFAACGETQPEQTKAPEQTNAPEVNKPDETKAPEATEAPESETPLVIQWDQANGTDRFEPPYKDSSLSYHTYMMWAPAYQHDQSKGLTTEERLYFDDGLYTGYERAADNMSVTVTIREGAFWSDGEPITVDDVIFGIYAAIFDPVSTSATGWKNVVGYEAAANGEADTLEGIKVDGNKITFSFVEPDASWIPSAWTLPAHCFEGIAWADLSTAPYWSAPVTSGPYKFVDAKFPDYANLTRNEYYFGEPAGIKNVTCLSFEASDATAAIASMIAGESHITTRTVTTNAALANEIKNGNPGTVVIGMYSNNIRALCFNMGDRQDGNNKDLIVTDPNVRLAISLMVDEDTIGAYTNSRACKVVGNPDNQFTTHEYDNKEKSLDLEKAKSLLDAAGWDYSTVVEILCYYTDQVSIDVLEIIKADAAKIGFQFKINVVTENASDAIYTTKNWDLMFYQAGASDFNPASGPMGTLKPGSAWTWNEKQPWIGEKYGALAKTIESLVEGSAEHTAAVHELQKALHDDMMIVPIYINSTVIAYNGDVIYVPETAFDYYDNVLHFEEWKMLQ